MPKKTETLARILPAKFSSTTRRSNNAEHGLGMYSGQKYIRDNLIEQIQAIVDGDKATQGLKDAFAKFIETKDKTLFHQVLVLHSF